MYLNTRATAVGKSLGQLIGYGTVFIQILGKGDGGFGGFYVTQHGREGGIAVEQYFDSVSTYDRRVGVGFNRGEKTRLADNNVWYLVDWQYFGATQE